MKAIVLLTLVLFFSHFTYAQQTIALEDVSKHVGDSVKVCGKV